MGEKDGTGGAAAVDLWDRIDEGWSYRRLPPESLSELLSGESSADLFVRAAGHGVWELSRSEGGVEVFLGNHPTEAAAKAAGDAEIAEAEAALPERAAAHAGLDPEVWALVGEDPPAFAPRPGNHRGLDAARLAIAADGTSQKERWQAWDGEESVSAHDTPAGAAEALLARASAAAAVPGPRRQGR